MTIAKTIKKRGITEILHFTTNKGVLGILDAKAVRARKRLNADERLEYIFQPNATVRLRDAEWLDYVNLSISRVNSEFFAVSAGSWHRYRDLWWCVLAFNPELLGHNGVVFTTTNNIYSGVKRASGPNGLEALFAEQITRWYGNVVKRATECPPNFTTCEQAEVLYPGEVSTELLQRIYVPTEEIGDELAGQIRAVGHSGIDIAVAPRHFEKVK